MAAHRRTLPALLLLVSAIPAFGLLDSDGDGMSDLWRQLYPAANASADSDGDGFSDALEAVAGTDPFNRADRMAIDSITRSEAGESVAFTWQAVVGKAYFIERFDPTTGSWTEAGSSGPAAGGPRQLTVPATGPAGIFRLRVADADTDADGLSAWEESLLGYGDTDRTSSGQSGRHDYAAGFRALEGTGSLTLADGRVVQRRATSRDEASRFLVQASLGAEPAAITQVATQGIGPWLDTQFTMPASSSYNRMWEQDSFFTYDALMWRRGWWRTIMLAQDQLRQRMAFALSQIFVINCDNGSVIGDNPITQAYYYDLLVNGSLGSYRSVLENVSYSAQMGFYLSHLLNRKGDPAENRFPDENFAREIMQLFTIGLWELNPDGSRKEDGQGNFIPTYDNDEITEMAKVFTGLSFSLNNGTPNQSFFTGGRGNDYHAPMKMFDTEHEPGAKSIVNGVVIPAGQTGDKDIDDALDGLCAHPNIGPFISRLLIQRFTSSDPSPEYISRVASVWQDNGSGASGNLKSVLEAILLDPEARVPDARGDASGRVREPLLRLTALLRAFTARNPGNTFPVWSGDLMQSLGVFPLLAPSVFNFYSPDHRPAGEMRQRGLVAPELEIATTSRLILTDNLLRSAIDTHFYTLVPDFSAAIALAGDTEALLDYLDELLTWGRMSPATRATIRSAVNAQTDATAKVKTAIHLIAESPDFVVLK